MEEKNQMFNTLDLPFDSLELVLHFVDLIESELWEFFEFVFQKT